MARVTDSRAHGLDGLRGLAALAVLVLHVWMYTAANDPNHDVLVDRVIGEFRTAVLLFFVLSAFLLAAPWVAASRGERPAPHLGRFALRRASRIVPGYLVALAGSLLLIHGTGHPRDIGLDQVPLFLLFIPNLDPATRNMLDPPMWTLHVEVTFYLVLPLIGWALLRLARRREVSGPLALCGALTGVSVAWVATSYVAGWSPEVTWTLPTYLGAFGCGIGAAVLAHGRRISRRTALGLALAGSVAVFLNAAWHSGGGTGATGVIVGDLPASAGFAAIVVAVAGRPAHVLGLAPLRALGAISLGVYLWHMPVLYALQIRGAFPEDAFGPALWRVLGPTLVLAIASWVLVERPALRWSARLGRRGSRVATAGRPASAEAGQ
jgi:peptidoglycan/LPS O-acetylase OafA/YrhL